MHACLLTRTYTHPCMHTLHAYTCTHTSTYSTIICVYMHTQNTDVANEAHKLDPHLDEGLLGPNYRAEAHARLGRRSSRQSESGGGLVLKSPRVGRGLEILPGAFALRFIFSAKLIKDPFATRLITQWSHVRGLGHAGSSKSTQPQGLLLHYGGRPQPRT